jgi:hypothetical protein
MRMPPHGRHGAASRDRLLDGLQNAVTLGLEDGLSENTRETGVLATAEAASR